METFNMASKTETLTPAEFQLKDILLPVDFSPLTAKALDCASFLWKRFGGVIHLVHVADPLPIIAGIDAMPFPIDDSNRISFLERDLANLANQLPAGSVGRTIVHRGFAVDEILSVGKE